MKVEVHFRVYQAASVLNNLNSSQYHQVNVGKFTIKMKNIADSYILTHNNDILIKVLNIVESKEHKAIIIGKIFKFKESVFEHPIKSKVLDIYKVKEIDSKLQPWPIAEIKKNYDFKFR